MTEHSPPQVPQAPPWPILGRFCRPTARRHHSAPPPAERPEADPSGRNKTRRHTNSRTGARSGSGAARNAGLTAPHASAIPRRVRARAQLRAHRARGAPLRLSTARAVRRQTEHRACGAQTQTSARRLLRDGAVITCNPVRSRSRMVATHAPRFQFRSYESKYHWLAGTGSF